LLNFFLLVKKLTVLPRWVIVLIDLWVVTFSAVLAFALRFNFQQDEMLMHKIGAGVVLMGVTALLASFVTKSYSGIVRYTGIDDAIRIFYTSFLTVVLSIAINLVYYYNVGLNLIPYSVLIIFFFVSFLFLVYYRLLVKSVFSYVRNDLTKKNNVVIFGAGQIGMLAKQALDAEARSKSKVIAFFEDDDNKAGKAISGIPIYKSAELSSRIDLLGVAEVIIAVKHLSNERKDEIVELCISKKVKVRMVPSFDKWVKGEFRAGQIKEVNIEDLLGRDSIQLDNTNLLEAIKGRVICVTGASGSIGSEIARQLINYQAESPLYELERELMNIKSPCRISFHLMDVTNQERMRALFRDYKLEWVFHAAAYKHVPVMESNPAEAVSCNIMGTKLLADLSIEFGVNKFVMISTDKAVNPTSIMGCSKRIAEIYVQSLNNHIQVRGGNHTMFVTTRFGNVLGSNGSVIPIFKKQIETGGPITVTHPEVTRFFMTIPEACRLVLEAGTIGHGGEIFIFDMGKSVRIYDLAKKMVLLSGLELGKDIDIVFTGLRDGEKLYEELLSNNEDTLPTHHQKILKAKVREYEFTHVNSMIELLGDLITDANELKMVTLMKDLVPEYKSNYSKFEILDRH
jgi:FlaA1/EpsC-like NDP-sugar epimerase